MVCDFIQDVLFKRKGILKTIEVEIPQMPIYFIDTLHFYKCKKYKTMHYSEPIIEMGIYFKFIKNNKIQNDLEFKVDLDIKISDKEKHTKSYDISSLREILSKYGIDDMDYVCNKVLESIKHDYF